MMKTLLYTLGIAAIVLILKTVGPSTTKENVNLANKKDKVKITKPKPIKKELVARKKIVKKPKRKQNKISLVSVPVVPVTPVDVKPIAISNPVKVPATPTPLLAPTSVPVVPVTPVDVKPIAISNPVKVPVTTPVLSSAPKSVPVVPVIPVYVKPVAIENPVNIQQKITNTPISEVVINLDSLDNKNTEDEYYDEFEDMDTGGGFLDSTIGGLVYLKSKLTISKKHPDRGFYGHLKYLYAYTDYESDGNHDSTLKDMTSEIKLGYLGNIYSPRLLDYKIEGIYRYITINKEYENKKAETVVRSKDYLANLNFIKSTNYPFRVFSQKSDRPVSTVYDSSSIEYSQDIEKHGVSGSLMFEYFTLGYGASTEKNIKEGILTKEEAQSDRYKASIRHSNDFHNLQLNYNHEDRKSDVTTIDGNVKIDNKDDTADLIYRAKLTKYLTLNSGARYTQSEYYNSNSLQAHLNLRWLPKEKYNAFLSINGGRNENYNYINDNKVTNTTDTLSLSQSFNYKATKELTFSQNIGLYTYESDKSKGETANLRMGANYNKSLSNDTRLQARTSVDTRINKTETISTTDEKESIEKSSYSINAMVGLSESLPSIKSVFNINSGYNAKRSKLEDNRDHYDVGLGLISNIGYGFRNNIYTSYMLDETEGYNEATNNSLNNTITRFDIRENIDYSTRIGIRGRFTGKSGVRYESIQNNNLVVERIVPYIDLNANYRFLRNIRFNSGFHLDKDLSYNYLHYSANANINYTIRKIQMSMGAKYYKTESESEQGTEHYTQNTRFEFKLTRRF